MTKDSKISKGKIVALGAGAVAIGAVAYYFLGPKGKQHQKSAERWAGEVKEKIVKEIEKQKEMTKSIYENIVDKVVKSSEIKDATSEEIRSFTKALKQDWKHIVTASKNNAKKSVNKIKKEIKNI